MPGQAWRAAVLTTVSVFLAHGVAVFMLEEEEVDEIEQSVLLPWILAGLWD